MKTPIEELKEYMFSGKNYYVDEFFKPFIEKEKQAIIDAWIEGVSLSGLSENLFLDGEKYYKEIFNK